MSMIKSLLLVWQNRETRTDIVHIGDRLIAEVDPFAVNGLNN